MWEYVERVLAMRFGLMFCVLFSVILGARTTVAEKPVWVAKVLRKLPRDEAAMATAHKKSRDAAVQVIAGDPLQVFDFAENTSYGVTVGGKKLQLPYRYSRLGALTYGMQLTPEDQASLPSVSKRRILRKVNGNYISLQLRVQRDEATGNVYLYYKPFAVVGAYGNAERSQEFSPLMEDSVRDVRGVGLFVKPGTPPSAEAFRTFVAINKNTLAIDSPDSDEPVLKPHYEFFFGRLRVDGDAMQLHVFGTTQHRTQLNYFQAYSAPTTPEECMMLSTIFFTEYTIAKQSPSAKAARDVVVQRRRQISLDDADAFATEKGYEGDAWDNLTAILDAIIDGDLQ